MGWAIVLEGRTDPSGTLLLSDDRRELENIAFEVRRRGHPVVVRPYPDRSQANGLRGTSTRAAAP
jgi:hypothetical protein